MPCAKFRRSNAADWSEKKVIPLEEDLYQFMDPHQRMLVDPDQIEHDQYLVYAPWNPDQLLDHLQATNREIDRRELKSNLQHRRDMEVASDDAKTETAEPEEVLETAEPEEVLGSDPVAAREATSPHAPVEPEKPDHRTSKVESLSQGAKKKDQKAPSPKTKSEAVGRGRPDRRSERVSILPILQPTHRTQEALESLLGKAYFGLMCARWAALFFWEDRQELLADAKSAIWQELSGHNAPPPPKSRRQVSEELQPFRWALYVALLYSLWDMISKVTRGFA
ncbi:unnamed protein product [Durusdinium trenchii]|uniref:Uncharacterized protein n=1 Tax=Durusdinium trenchii TaxID=1381693 RepID=A0ABP0PFF1_9DINO